MNTIPFVDLASQYEIYSAEIQAALTDVMRRTDFILGRDVRLFEEEFAAFGAPYGRADDVAGEEVGVNWSRAKSSPAALYASARMTTR